MADGPIPFQKDKPIYIFVRDPQILSSGTAAKYLSVEEAKQMVADLQDEIGKYDRCTCHASKKCAFCMMKDGDV